MRPIPTAASLRSRSRAPERVIVPTTQPASGLAPRRGRSRLETEGDAVYLRPEALLAGPAATAAALAGTARPLGGGPLAFSAVAVVRRRGTHVEEAVLSLDRFDAWLAGLAEDARAAGAAMLARAAHRRPPLVAGLAADRPLVMGVVNVTPDSFSDGGEFADPAAAIAHGRRLLAEGADLVDVGGESTRPGAEPVPVETELRRVLPVIAALAGDGAVVSIDTRRAAVMRAALAAGARIVNDVTALRDDADAVGAVAENGAAVILMHMQGDPRTMQEAPRYVHAPTEIHDFLSERVEACRDAGVPAARIAVDPGFGFGKTVEHNLEIVRDLPLLLGLGVTVAVGLSRKSSLGRIAGVGDARDRLPASLAAAVVALGRGAGMLRVHDVAATRQAVAVWRALAGRGAAAEGSEGADRS
jgi:dihydropteroate synthase